MTLQEQFIDAVKRALPEVVNGVAPHSVDYPETMQDAVIVALYFLRAFDKGGNPVDRPLSDVNADWRQAALHVTASGREIRMNAHDLDGLARKRIEAAIAVIPTDDPFFAQMAA